jgi:hypothetical protein
MPEIVNFTLSEPTKSEILNVRSFNHKLYLCSPDFEDKIEIKSSKDLPFEDVSNNFKVFFGRDGEIWKMRVRG